MTFVKLYDTILRSSIWLESQPTRLVWIAMLAMADEAGVVEASVGGLAHTANVPLDDCREALRVLLSPDPDSRDGTTGERIEKVDGGWLVLNHAVYRDKRTRRQIQTAERTRRWRERTRVTGDDVTLGDVTSHPVRTDAEAYTDTEKKKTPPNPPAKRRGKRVEDLPIPDPLDTEGFRTMWAEWIEHRRLIKSPMTALAGKRVLAKCESIGEAEARRWMDNAIEKGWRGLYPPGDDEQGSGTTADADEAIKAMLED